jgi:hypothetical protein
MPKFRKKPVVIEAMEWNGTNLREVIDFTGLHPSAEKWTCLVQMRGVRQQMDRPYA